VRLSVKLPRLQSSALAAVLKFRSSQSFVSIAGQSRPHRRLIRPRRLQSDYRNLSRLALSAELTIQPSIPTASGAAVHSPGTATRQPDPNFRPRVENDAAKQLTVQARPAPSAEHQHPAVEPAKMTPQQKLYFQQEYDKLIRNPSTALILTLLLGGFGAHRFYLKQWGWGIAYIFFVWTFIPVIVSIIECFLIMQRTRDYNEQCSRGIMEKMNVIFSEPEIAVAMRLR
jgi:TM2 domain-containing membrane protein YozV